MPIKTYLITENDLQSLIRETDLESFYRASSQYKRHDEDREKSKVSMREHQLKKEAIIYSLRTHKA